MKATILKFQFKNCLNRRNSLILIWVVAFLFIFIIGNTWDYKNFLEEKKAFTVLENEKVKNYQNYEQYGAYGFSVLNEPSPLSIYFRNSNYFMLESNIDTKEVLKFNSSYAGSVLSQNRHFDSFQFFLYCGSLLMILAGVGSLPQGLINFLDDRRKAYITIVSKMVVCIFLTFSIMLASYFLPSLFGISFTLFETVIYLKYTGYIIIFFSLLFTFGAIISILSKDKLFRLLWATAVCLMLIFAIPEMVNTKKIKSNTNEIHLKKIKNVMEFEKKSSSRLLKRPSDISSKEFYKKLAIEFTSSVYLENKKIEDSISQEYSDYINYQEESLYLIPGAYLEVIHNELSSKGIYSYRGFRQYICDLRKAFIDFYITMRFGVNEKREVENFVKGSENIFRASSVIPKNFYKSLLANLCYLILALIAIHRLLCLKVQARSGELDVKKLKPGQSYFYLYTDRQDLMKVTSFFDNPLIINELCKDALVEAGTKVFDWMEYIACLFETSIIDLKMKIEGTLGEQTKENSIEYLRLFLLLVKLEGKNKDRMLILDSYLKGLDFMAIKKIQNFLGELNRTILYTSPEMFVIGNMDKTINKNRIIPIDLREVYLR